MIELIEKLRLEGVMCIRIAACLLAFALLSALANELWTTCLFLTLTVCMILYMARLYKLLVTLSEL